MTTSEPNLDLGQIFELNDQFHDSALLHFAVNEQLFDELSTEKSAAYIADKKRWDMRKTEIMLNALCSLQLLPTGTLVVLTMRLDDTGTQPPGAAGFSFYMMLNTKEGGLHPTPFIAETMKENGFEVEEILIGTLQRYAMLIGRKY